MAASPTVGRDSQRLSNTKKSCQEQQQSKPIDSNQDNTSLTVNLPGKLSILGKVTSLLHLFVACLIQGKGLNLPLYYTQYLSFIVRVLSGHSESYHYH